MAIYSILGDSLNKIYDINGGELIEAYDADSNIVFRGGKDPYIDGRTLLFEDDFSGDSLNENNWSYEIGNVRGSELQFYRSQNIVVKNSNLIIKALRETHLNKGWTSGSITGQLKKSWLYGRFEAKIKFPNVVGAFGAFWTLGANHWIEYKSDDDPTIADNRPVGSVAWPQCGEIDIIETIPLGNTQNPPANLWSNSGVSLGSTAYPSNIDISQYHIYSMEWTSDYIAMLIDGNEYKKWTFSDYTAEQIAPYKLAQYILLDLAVGAGSASNIPAESTTEMKMHVDWVRVYAPLTQENQS